MTVHLIDLRSDVSRCFAKFYSVLFYLCTLTFVMLNWLIVLFGGEIQVTQKQILILCIY